MIFLIEPVRSRFRPDMSLSSPCRCGFVRVIPFRSSSSKRFANIIRRIVSTCQPHDTPRRTATIPSKAPETGSTTTHGRDDPVPESHPRRIIHTARTLGRMTAPLLRTPRHNGASPNRDPRKRPPHIKHHLNDMSPTEWRRPLGQTARPATLDAHQAQRNAGFPPHPIPPQHAPLCHGLCFCSMACAPVHNIAHHNAPLRHGLCPCATTRPCVMAHAPSATLPTTARAPCHGLCSCAQYCPPWPVPLFAILCPCSQY